MAVSVSGFVQYSHCPYSQIDVGAYTGVDVSQTNAEKKLNFRLRILFWYPTIHVTFLSFWMHVLVWMHVLWMLYLFGCTILANSSEVW